MYDNGTHSFNKYEASSVTHPQYTDATSSDAMELICSNTHLTARKKL